MPDTRMPEENACMHATTSARTCNGWPNPARLEEEIFFDGELRLRRLWRTHCKGAAEYNVSSNENNWNETTSSFNDVTCTELKGIFHQLLGENVRWQSCTWSPKKKRAEPCTLWTNGGPSAQMFTWLPLFKYRSGASQKSMTEDRKGWFSDCKNNWIFYITYFWIHIIQC